MTTISEVLENVFQRGYAHGISGGISDDGETYAVSQATQQIHDLIMECVKAYDEYIKTLREELDEVVPIAYMHGWRSERYEEGKKLRKNISETRKKLEGVLK